MTVEAIEIDGATWRFSVDGPADGRPVLYLHSFFGEHGPLPLFEQLADSGYRVVAPLVPGVAGTDDAGNVHNVLDVVWGLTRLLDHLGIQRVTVVGSSLGGWLAAELAVWYPRRIERLVLAAPFGITVAGAEPVNIFTARARVVDEASAAGRTTGRELLAAIDRERFTGDALNMHVAYALEAAARIGWNPVLRDARLAQRLAVTDVEGVVLRGDEDGIIPAAHSEAFAAIGPGLRYESVPGAGHLLGLEAPTAVVNAVLDVVVA